MSSFSRPNDRKRNRDHIPTMHSEQLARPQSAANIDIAGPRNPDLMARRQQERKPSDGAIFLKAFGNDKPKFPIQNPFHAASHKFEQQDRLAQMQLRDVQRPCVRQDIPRPPQRRDDAPAAAAAAQQSRKTFSSARAAGGSSAPPAPAAAAAAGGGGGGGGEARPRSGPP